MILRFLQGASQGFLSNSTMALVSHNIPAERENNQAICRMMDFLGVFFGIILEIIFASYMELPGILLINAVIALLHLFYAYFEIPDSYNDFGD